MKIGLDVSVKEAVRQYTSVPESPRYSKTDSTGAVRLDITGMYTDVNAYAVHGRTTEDLKKEAANIDVSTVRDYMTVMSNTMSGDDYKKAMEEGFDPSDMDPEKSQTIIDNIKAVMAESGQVVAGFNDDLSDEQLKDITGRDIDIDSIKRSLKEADIPDTPDNVKKISEAVAMMSEIDSLSEGSVKYMVENDMAPTVGNIYTSTFSASGDGSRQAKGYYGEDMPGYLARKADNVDLTELKPQLEKLTDDMDIEGATKEEKLKDAGWLLTKGIPVTAEKMENLRQINSVVFPVPARTIVAASMEAIASGLSPKDADLSVTDKRTYKEAYETQNKAIDASIGREQARLMMSLDANVRLVRSGISIDTQPIEDVISSLKEEQKELFKAFFGEDKDPDDAGNNGNNDAGVSSFGLNTIERKIEVFAATTQAVREIPQMPAALIGRIGTEDDGVFTIGRAHKLGSDYRATYEAASQTYEAVGTEVRRDLGDSITKAFRNVDDILGELGLDISAENQRAVRILGYNSMVITEENIQKIKIADSKLTGALKALTPGKTLQLIREGINPLDMKIDELVNHISELDHDPKREAEKYSRFLYKLEKSGKISDEERTSYVGIYRMLNRIERTDHSALGRLIESETDMTFGNLLTAMRSKGTVIDAGIDDDFGMLADRIPRGISITDQIEEAFKNRISDEEYNRLDEEYLRENAEQIRETASADDIVYNRLFGDKVDITPNNIMAEAQFLNAPNDLFRNLRAYARRTDRRITDTEDAERTGLEKGLSDAIDQFADKMDDRDTAKASYRSLTETMTETLTKMTDHGADSLIDLKSISLMYKQISLAMAHSESEDYHIPVLMDGRYVDINLRLQHGKETGLVTAMMDTEAFGSIQAQIRVRGMSVEAGFIADDRQNLDALIPVADAFVHRLDGLGYEDVNTRFLTGDPKADVKHQGADADNNIEAVDTKALYNIAKQFIYAIRSGGNL